MIGLGTIINIITVLVGGSIGLFARRGLSSDFRERVMKGLGLITLVIGFRMALATEKIFIPMSINSLLLLLIKVITGFHGR